MVKTVSPWTTEGCHECGEEFQLAHERSITIDENAVLLCESCETYAKGYQDGLAAHECKVQPDSRWSGVPPLMREYVFSSLLKAVANFDTASRLSLYHQLHNVFGHETYVVEAFYAALAELGFDSELPHLIPLTKGRHEE